MTMNTRVLVPMASVADVERSIAFYRHLGFEVGNTFVPAGAPKRRGLGSSAAGHS
jgi:catechol 2,3-dioxygenase-like lactoylglutathione lyase family enzyme